MQLNVILACLGTQVQSLAPNTHPPKKVCVEDTVGKLKSKMATHIMGNEFVNHVFDKALISIT